LPTEVEQKVEEIEGVTKAYVEITFDPTWDRDMMSEEAKFELGML
jgi:Predicted metal-sulfur cluster biosynthetic enzyme